MKKIILIFLFFFAYHILYVLFSLANYFPSVFQLFEALLRNFSSQEIYLHMIASLPRILIVFLIASVVGISMGLVLAHYQRIKYLTFYIELLRPIPPIAWIPIAIIIFGLDNSSAYFIVFLGAFFPIFTNTYIGALSIPTIYKNIALSFQINEITYFFKILFFFALPHIFTGLKIVIGMAWMSVIAAELTGAQSGLGYYIQLNRLLLQTDNIIIGMMLIGIIGNLLQKLIDITEKMIVV